MVAEFGQPGGIGEELQRRLLKRAEERDSWVGIGEESKKTRSNSGRGEVQ